MTRKDWRRKRTGPDPKHHIMCGTWRRQCYGMDIYGCIWNRFTADTVDDVTANRSIRMNAEVYRVILSAHIQPNGRATLESLDG